MRRELRLGLSGLRRRPLAALLLWSVPEALPVALTGIAVANAVDDGFRAGRPLVGLGWLGGLLLAGAVGGLGSGQVYRRLGEIVEPFRDMLVRRVVAGALQRGVSGEPDDGAVARLTRQVEFVRDAYAGVLVLLSGFAVALVGVTAGLLALAPQVAALVLAPFLLGIALLVVMLGRAAGRYRRAVHADERLAAATGEVLSGLRDVVACGAEEHAARLVTGAVAAQAGAERALARTDALRTTAFAVGGWAPLLVLLVAAPWLLRAGLSTGALMGGFTYVLFGLQPVLRTLGDGFGGAGLRFVVTLARILDAAPPPPRPPLPVPPPAGHELTLRGVGFRYRAGGDPVLHELDLTIAEAEHVAVVGPSGIGKSTLAGLVCGLLRPTTGSVLLGGAAATGVSPATRVLIPQQAYVFSGSVRANLTYLRPHADDAEVMAAVAAVGATALVARVGGLAAALRPAALSAGERQLVALARAYLAAAPVVVLDEATCHLDPAAERRAEEAFAAAAGTLVVIAHRISSARRAQRVLVFDGTRATAGTHDELQERSALYRELCGSWTSGAAAITRGATPISAIRRA